MLNVFRNRAQASRVLEENAAISYGVLNHRHRLTRELGGQST